MINLEKPSLEDLTHYGVKGMHWGHHKRPDTVEIVDARAAKEKEKASFKKAQKLYNKQTAYGLLHPTEKEQKVMDAATREYTYKKEDLGRAKILNKLKSKPKSEEQLKLEAKYKNEKKMSEDEAAVAAYQHIRTKKMLMVIGGLTVAAAVAYTGYKLHDARVDKIIKAGTTLQHITPEKMTIGMRDAFYATNNKIDNVKYKGYFGNEIKRRYGGAVFKKEIQVLSDIRQASPKNAQMVLSKLTNNDPEFAKDLNAYFAKGTHFDQRYNKIYTQGKSALSKGIVDKNVYDFFNVNLVVHNPEMQSLSDRYFKALSEHGYNAIRDVNDSKYSGYNAINPIIAFGTQGKTEIVNVKKLADQEISKNFNMTFSSMLTGALSRRGAILTGMLLTSDLGTKAINKSQNQKAIDKYRQENPNTTMTNTEIIRMIERSKG